MPDLTDQVTRRQGRFCLMPDCPNEWTDLAHIWGRGMGGVPSLRDNPRHVVGLCHECHMTFDGQSTMKGRQRMLRLLMESRRDLVELERCEPKGST